MFKNLRRNIKDVPNSVLLATVALAFISGASMFLFPEVIIAFITFGVVIASILRIVKYVSDGK